MSNKIKKLSAYSALRSAVPIALYHSLYQSDAGTRVNHALAKVFGTKIRGGGYHKNLIIPLAIRHLYKGAALLTGTLETSDAKAAANKITTARSKMIEQMEEVARTNDITARLAELAPEQRALYDHAGGLEGLIAAFHRTQTAQAFMQAGDPSVHSGNDYPGPDPLEAGVIIAEHRAATAALSAMRLPLTA